MSSHPNTLPENLPSVESPARKTVSRPRKARLEKRQLKSGLNSDPESESLLKRLRSLPARPRRNEALKRLGITEKQLQSSPNITSILKETHGGIKLSIGALRFSQNEAVQLFLKKYDSISERDRKSIPLEAIAIKVGVDIRMLLGEIMIAVREHSVSRVKMIAIANHPEVIKSRVKFAK